MRQVRWITALSTVLVSVVAGLGVPCAAPAAMSRSVPGSELEAPGVREAIERESMQEPGPLVSSEGATGGSAEPSAPAGGKLQVARSTAFSDTWLVGRREQVTRIYAAPVNYRGSDGAWHAIDNGLVAAAMGGYENAANSFSLNVPMSLSDGLKLSTSAGTISASLQWGREAMPSVQGSTARYGEALSGTDLEYESTSTGVKETAVLKNASAPSSIGFVISIPASLSAKSTAGGIEILDHAGNVAFTLPAPVAYPVGHSPDSGRSLPVSLTASSHGVLLSVDTGVSWLREELASGPVAVDPSLEVGGSQNCTVESDEPKASYCSQTTMDVGYQSSEPAHEHHGLLEFNLSALPEGAEVLYATLGLYLQSHSTSNSKPVGVYRVTKPWTTSATWEAYDGTHAWTTAGGDYSSGEDGVVDSSVGTSTGWTYWYPTKMVQEWANGSSEAEEGAPNDGLVVKDQTDNSINNVLSFDSIHASEHKPFLEIGYENPGVGREPQWTSLNYPVDGEIDLGVNVASGNLIAESKDLHIAGRGEDFSSVRRFNSLDPNAKDYGRFNDSNDIEAEERPNGDFIYVDETDAHFVFVKKSDGSFITPPGIKAVLCTAGHAPCPTTLPSGITHRLIYDAEQNYLDFNIWGFGSRKSDRHENALTAGFTEGVGDITSWTDTEGRKIIYKTTPGDMYSEIKDEAGERKLTYEYELTSEGELLIASKDAAGHATKYHWEHGNLASITTPAGNVTRLFYNSAHQIEYINPTTNAGHTEGPATRFIYYAAGTEHNPCGSGLKATVVEDPDGVAEREEEEEKEEHSAEREKFHTTTYCSNVHDEVVKTLNANGKESTATFDPTGNTLTTTAAARETGASPGVSSLVYGTGGANLACEEQSSKSVSECPTGALKEGYASRYSYGDSKYSFQPTEALSARQKTTKLCYWEGGATCTAGGSGAAGELKAQTLPLSGEPKMSFTYNSQGLVTSATDPDGHTTTYEYDSNGNLKTVIPPSGSGLGKTIITVDALSRPHTIAQCLTESGGTCTSGITATLTYDALDRVIEAVDTGPGATKTFNYTYDGDGNLVKQVDPNGTTTSKYDPLDRLTEEAEPESISNSYSYDEASNLTSFTDAGGTTEYKYDQLNELQAMAEPSGNCGTEPAKCTTFQYDGDGSLTKITYPSKATLNYGIDAATGRPTSITAKNPAGETLLSHTYSYLTEGNDTPLIYKDTLNQPGTGTSETSYEYDPLDRLLEATSKSTTATLKAHYAYELDAAGNRTKQETSTTAETGGEKTYYDYNAGNELECRMKEAKPCSSSSSSELAGYTYDKAGNETEITGYAETGNTSFVYNNLNQLKTLTPPSGTAQSLYYLGSGQSNLIELGATDLQNSALGTTSQSNAAGTSYYARTPGGLLVDERLPGGTHYTPIQNANGDVIALLNSSGTLAQTVRYGPYGESAQAEAKGAEYSSTNDPFLYHGGYHMEGGEKGAGNILNGLYHFGERYYDPTVGRWTQMDPTGNLPEYEAYGDDPVNESDPSGCVQAKTPEARFAEHMCDEQRERESTGRRHIIGDFTGQGRTEPGRRYPGTSYELIYEQKNALGLLPQVICHVIVARRPDGHFYASHGPHFRVPSLPWGA